MQWMVFEDARKNLRGVGCYLYLCGLGFGAVVPGFEVAVCINDRWIEAWLGLSSNGPWLSLPTPQLGTVGSHVC